MTIWNLPLSETLNVETTGRGIAESILQEFESRGVEATTIVSLGSDGASVMTGKENGKN